MSAFFILDLFLVIVYTENVLVGVPARPCKDFINQRII